MLKTNPLLLFFLCLTGLFSQTEDLSGQDSYRFVFYNVENYFDPYPDTLVPYDEFDPGGVRGWSSKKYLAKRDNIYKTLAALGEWEMPALVAFAEIENQKVIESLLETPLGEGNYGIIHRDSPDERGIDVGLIYARAVMVPLTTKFYRIALPDTANTTRDILYVKFLLAGDTLHFFVNHWPSRYGGLLETEAGRLVASQVLRSITDSVCAVGYDPKILVMGDFNDNPDDKSIRALTTGGCLLPLQVKSKNPNVKGTYKYRMNWENFDQVMVSNGLISGILRLQKPQYQIFDGDFLLENDEKYQGLKPKRTYSGFKYTGGFSDHLPVYVDIYAINDK